MLNERTMRTKSSLLRHVSKNTGGVLREDFWKKELLGIVLLSGILIWLSLKDLSSLSTIYILGDEYGYWGVAAKLAGYNWETVGLTGYYSYGYSLLLVPIMWITQNSAIWYAYAIVLNAVLLVGAFFLAIYFGKQMFPRVRPFYVTCTAFVCMLYPNVSMNTQIGWPETLLYFLFWAQSVLLVCILKKFSLWQICLFTVLSLYTYAVHQRTVGIFLASLIVSAFVLASNLHRFKNAAITVGVDAALAGFHILILKPYLKENIWSIAVLQGEATNNDYSSIFGSMLRYLRPEGFSYFLASLFGQSINLIVSTLFLLPIAVFFGVFLICRNICTKGIKKSKDYRTTVMVFLGLSLLSSLCISALFMAGPSNHMNVYVYGRYIENCIGPLLLIGALFLWNYQFVITKAKAAFLWTSIAVFFGALFVEKIATRMPLTSFNSAGNATLFFLYNRGCNLFEMIIIALMLGWVLFALVFHGGNRRSKISFCFTFVFAISLWMIASNSVTERFRSARSQLNSQEEVLKTRKLSELGHELFWYADGEEWRKSSEGLEIAYTQFLLPTKNIRVYDPSVKEMKQAPTSLLVHKNVYKADDALRQEYPMSEDVLGNVLWIEKVRKGQIYNIFNNVLYMQGMEEADEKTENEEMVEVEPAKKKQMKQNLQAIALNKNGMQYGPYFDLKAGTYEVTISGMNLSKADIRVTYDLGAEKVALNSIERMAAKTTYTFTLNRAHEGIEFICEAVRGPVKIFDITLEQLK